MKNVVHLAFGLALLIAQAAIASFIPLHPFAPCLLLPIVIYLGVDPDVELLRGVALSFVLGYFGDEIAAVPTGLTTFVLVATFLATRGAGIRLVLRGAPFQIGLTFAVSIVASGTMLALRAIFQPPEAFPLVMPPAGVLGWFFGQSSRLGNPVALATTMIASGLATGLSAPLVFAAVRRIERISQRTRRSANANETVVSS